MKGWDVRMLHSESPEVAWLLEPHSKDMRAKIAELSVQAFTDWLRLELLCKSGGLWMDAMIFLHDPTYFDRMLSDCNAATELFAQTNKLHTKRGASFPVIESALILCLSDTVPVGESHFIRIWLTEFLRAVYLGFKHYREDLQKRSIDPQGTYVFEEYLTVFACALAAADVKGVFSARGALVNVDCFDADGFYGIPGRRGQIKNQAEWDASTYSQQFMDVDLRRSFPVVKLTGGERHRVLHDNPHLAVYPLRIENPQSCPFTAISRPQRRSEIVAALYNENIDWLLPISHKTTVYAKSPARAARREFSAWIPLPNVGRESHTYLYHIASNYHSLAEVTVFTQGNIEDHVPKGTNLLVEIDDLYREALVHGFSELNFSGPNSFDGERIRHCCKWLDELKEGQLSAAPESPRQFYETFLGKPMPKEVWYYHNGVFAVRRDHIQHRPREFYQRLEQRLARHVNPDEGHYMERFWRSVFASSPERIPCPGAVVLRAEAGGFALAEQVDVTSQIRVIMGSQPADNVIRINKMFPGKAMVQIKYMREGRCCFSVTRASDTLRIEYPEAPVYAVIVGAGLSGATMANRLATQLNRRVLVVDSRGHIGGNAYDRVMPDSGLLESQYGAHLFHTNNEKVWSYVQQFATWVPWEHKVQGQVKRADGRKVHVPIPANIKTVNALFDAGIADEAGMKAFMDQERAGQPADAECINSEQAGKARVGPRLFDALFRDYTQKQWGVSAAELDASVLRRIPVRENFDDRYFGDKYQALPSKGYTDMVRRMLDHPLITVRLSTDFFAEREKLEAAAEYIVYTGPVDRFFAGSGLPRLQYRSIDFHRRVLRDSGYAQPSAVINFPGADTPYTRTVEYKHFLAQKSEYTALVSETTTADGEPYYPVPSAANQALHEKYKALVQEREDSAAFPKVRFVGRLANYKYMNMDEAIAAALDLFEKEFQC